MISSSAGDMSFDKLKSSGVLKDIHAVHCTKERDHLIQALLSFNIVWKLPIHDIEQYFGAEIAFYFAFLGASSSSPQNSTIFFFLTIPLSFYSLRCSDHIFHWLLPPAVVGIACQITALYYNDSSRPEIPVFSLFALVCMITSIQKWKKQQFLYSILWNTADSTERRIMQDHVRFHFKGQTIKSYINGRDTAYFPLRHRLPLYLFSFATLILCILGVFIAVLAIYYFRRYSLQDTGSLHLYDQWIIGAMTAAQIILCNKLFYFIDLYMTQLENQRLEDDFQSSFAGESSCPFIKLL